MIIDKRVIAQYNLVSRFGDGEAGDMGAPF